MKKQGNVTLCLTTHIKKKKKKKKQTFRTGKGGKRKQTVFNRVRCRKRWKSDAGLGLWKEGELIGLGL